MSFSAEFSVTSNGTRILVFFRHGREWYADFPIKDQRFAIGAQLAYFLCAYGDRLRQFEAKGAGLLSEGIFPEKISLGRGPVREVTWSLHEGLEASFCMISNVWHSGAPAHPTHSFPQLTDT